MKRGIIIYKKMNGQVVDRLHPLNESLCYYFLKMEEMKGKGKWYENIKNN